MFSNRKLVNLIGPLFIDQVLLITVMLLSTLMIAKAGANAISGVSLVDMVNTFILNVLIALAVGGSVVISQYIGSNNPEKAEKTAAQLISFNVIISLVICLVMVLFQGVILSTLFGNVEASVMDNIRLYYRLSIVSFPFYALYQAATAVFRAIGNTKVPLFSSLLMNVLNFVGNALSILVFGLGVYGVGLSAILARALAAALVLFLILKKDAKFKVQLSHVFAFHADLVKRILNIAIPNSIESGVLNLGRLLLASLVSSLGTAQIAANGVTNSLAPLAVSFGIAMSMGISTVIGQTVGANDFDQAKHYIKKLMLWTYVANAIMIALHTLFLPNLLSLYGLSSEISDLIRNLVYIHNIAALILFPISMVLPNALRAAGDAKFTMFVSILAMIIFRMGAAYFFALYLNMGVIGVWIAMVFDWSFRLILFAARYLSNRWTQFRLV